MTYQAREEIFAKEVLSISDIEQLMECSKSKAAELIRTWKRKLRFEGERVLRIDFDGKIHVLDYLLVMGLDPASPGERYFRKTEDGELAGGTSRRSVCR